MVAARKEILCMRVHPLCCAWLQFAGWLLLRLRHTKDNTSTLLHCNYLLAPNKLDLFYVKLFLIRFTKEVCRMCGVCIPLNENSLYCGMNGRFSCTCHAHQKELGTNSITWRILNSLLKTFNIFYLKHVRMPQFHYALTGGGGRQGR